MQDIRHTQPQELNNESNIPQGRPLWPRNLPAFSAALKSFSSAKHLPFAAASCWYAKYALKQLESFERSIYPYLPYWFILLLVSVTRICAVAVGKIELLHSPLWRTWAKQVESWSSRQAKAMQGVSQSQKCSCRLFWRVATNIISKNIILIL